MIGNTISLFNLNLECSLIHWIQNSSEILEGRNLWQNVALPDSWWCLSHIVPSWLLSSRSSFFAWRFIFSCGLYPFFLCLIVYFFWWTKVVNKNKKLSYAIRSKSTDWQEYENWNSYNDQNRQRVSKTLRTVWFIVCTCKMSHKKH